MSYFTAKQEGNNPEVGFQVNVRASDRASQPASPALASAPVFAWPFSTLASLNGGRASARALLCDAVHGRHCRPTSFNLR
ncbi:hypothetical protein T05_1413 [Trichinella murrelli]|uniref:Uncharacterized protein n=1 Tax=Trichinella murrelli TaxID=144512 RepID=A0A0V0TZP5_9BILA|nr:hypothetical protein T05_1413 [Trichinella murrelli]